MSSNLTFGILVYLIPFLILLGIFMCCIVIRENRRTRGTNIHRQIVPIVNPTQQNIAIVNPEQECSPENSLPPPYTLEPPSNFEDSLPTYERAINRPL